MSDSYDIPFVPSSDERLRKMIEFANVRPGMKAADIGSGDGKVVIALAKEGAEAHGYEIDYERSQRSIENINREGLEGKAFIHHMNFWDAEFGDYDVLTIYAITSIMKRLEEKLQREMKPGAILVSNYFTFPNWAHETKDGMIFVYRQKIAPAYAFT
jgi:ribosomal protein L11 methylase PrmA